MWQLRVLLLSAILAAGFCDYLDETYLAVFPKVMRPSQGYDVGLTYTYRNAAVGTVATATVSLLDRDDSQIIRHKTFQMPQATCGSTVASCPVSQVLTLPVPSSSELTKSTYNVTISGGDGTSTFFNSTDVKLKRKTISVFVQTDKAIYKPSQSVKFRVISVDADLKPVKTPLNISIHDSNENRIKQWLNVVSNDAVISNELELSEQPPLGNWYIQVEGQDTGEKKLFQVDEYVLPKYEVKVNVPTFFWTSDEKISASVGAEYTYGEPVKGNCTIRVQIKPYNYDSRTYPHMNIYKNLTDGEAKFEIWRSRLVGLVPTYTWQTWSESWARDQLGYRELLLMAKCVETLTKKTFEKNATIPMTRQKYSLRFMDITPDNFKPGLNLTVFLKLTLPDGSAPSLSELKKPNNTPIPIEIRDYYFYVSRYDPKPIPPANWTAFPDATGTAILSFQVPVNTTSLNIRARFNDTTGVNQVQTSRYFSQFKSRDKQGLQVTLVGSTGQIKRGQNIRLLVTTTQPSTRAYIQLLSKGKIVYYDVATYSPSTTHEFLVTMSDTLMQQLSPNARVIAWFSTASGEIISDSLDFQVDGTFNNNVTISFNVAEAKPGASVDVKVTAYNQSYVGILAQDKSVTLLATGNDLDKEDVIAEVKQYDSTNTYNDYYGFRSERGRKKRSSICYGCWWGYTGGKDAKEVFENAGLEVRTDRFLYVEPPPRYYYGRSGSAPRGERGPAGPAGPMGQSGEAGLSGERGERGPAGPAPSPSGSSLKEPTRVRTEFPETWLWTENHVGENGELTMTTKVPDTITSWVASAFAMHPEKGLGVSDNNPEMRVFKPFFLSLDLPYSIIRGEDFELKVLVFNYMKTEQDVVVTLEKSMDFGLKMVNELEYKYATARASLRIPPGDGKSFSIWVRPLVLGNIPLVVKAQSSSAADAVRRMILSEPEGAPQQYNVNYMVDLKGDDKFFKDDVTLALPKTGLVPGSVRITATAIGDIMGPSINNLGNLVRMPYGCGEQNMLNFAPNIFVMDYLTAANKHDPELKAKAIKYMEKGYQRELTYQHYDGSFSAFGNSDPSGSTWLTAFVLKSFCEAKEYIDVDPAKIRRGIKWLLNQQNRDGSFREPGRVSHTAMQGGSGSGIALSGYVTVTLIESCFLDTEQGLPKRVNDVIDSAVTYLLDQYEDDKLKGDSYLLAVTSYALVHRNHARATQMLDELDRNAKVADGMKHWERQEKMSSKKTIRLEDRDIFVPPRRQASASAIEATSYALLAFAENNQVSSAVPIMKWLTSQRNSLGGYSSTQDTVMALQALAKFAEAAGAGQTQDMQVTLRAGSKDFIFPERITSTNSMVLQEIDLTSAMNMNEGLFIEGSGSGLALVQISVDYNVQTTYEEDGMNIEVTSTEVRDGRVDVEVCTWYTGEEVSGMVVVEVTPLSGYTAANLQDLVKKVKKLKRAEQSGKKFAFYFDEMTGQRTCFVVQTERVNVVANVQKALVTSYVYYTPNVRKTTFYMPRGFLGMDVCKKCPECCPVDDVLLEFIDITKVSPGPIDRRTTTVPDEIINKGHSTRNPNIIWDWNTSGAGRSTPLVSVVLATIAMVIAVRFL